ncbi:hypothetical protein L484_001489 [Morus notabilis]|uniref:Uncharacterized protein n=1 Tax=Morus notabilis TaxID=981085 RepID=W9RQG3_9ROSA|nr:uncharacterized protein LOC21385090 [Morus notabilis]EXC03761.1 hypothetical protein L484_001489 [Morus notabilis]
MMDVWSWICELPNSNLWTDSESSPPVFELASSGTENSTRSIQLRAEKTSGSTIDSLVNFTVYLHGFNHVITASPKILWVSDTCHLSSEKPFLPLVLQLLQETVSRSPTAHYSTTPCPRSQLQKLKPDVVSWIMDSHSPESFSSFFSLVLLTRLFWLCACDAPTEVGSLYFRALLAPNIETVVSSKNSRALRAFFATVGVDAELRFMRTVGYMLAKWCILKEVGVGLQMLTPLTTWSEKNNNLGFSYATEAHGFWTLKGYAPIAGMKLTSGSARNIQFPVLKYVLAHQQLEAVIQFEYTVGFYEGLIQVNARVDNLRLHVTKLGYNKDNDDDDVELGEERHFPSRIRVWVGPEVGANYVAGLSLGRSSEKHGEREVETHSIVKGSFGISKMLSPKVKATSRTLRRTRQRSWRWDQDAEGNAAVFDAVLCDGATGSEVATWKPSTGGDDHGGFRDRYNGTDRVFTKSGGLVLAGDDYGEEVGWRLSKEMEGSVLKWRIGGKVWVSYWPNEVNSSYFETRCVEWCDEVDLPLIPPKLLSF